MAFPTLSILPNEVSWSPVENAVITDPEAGPVMARKRYTKTLYIFSVSYNKLGSSDRSSLISHYSSVGTWDIFDWVHLGTTYAVRFKSPIEYVDLPAGWTRVKFALQST